MSLTSVNSKAVIVPSHKDHVILRFHDKGSCDILQGELYSGKVTHLVYWHSEAVSIQESCLLYWVAHSDEIHFGAHPFWRSSQRWCAQWKHMPVNDREKALKAAAGRSTRVVPESTMLVGRLYTEESIPSNGCPSTMKLVMFTGTLARVKSINLTCVPYVRSNWSPRKPWITWVINAKAEYRIGREAHGKGVVDSSVIHNVLKYVNTMPGRDKGVAESKNSLSKWLCNPVRRCK